MGEFNEGIVIIVRAGVVWRGAGTLAVALGGGLGSPPSVIVRAGVVWRGAGTLAVALGGVSHIPKDDH